MRTLILMEDANGHPVQIMGLNDPQDVDGTNASAQSAAINVSGVRIFALTGDSTNSLRFLIGDNPVALATSHPIAVGNEIWMPIVNGQKVAILGGKASISTIGV